MLFAANIEYFKNLKSQSCYKKTLVLSIICSKCKNENEKIFKEEESIEILKIFGLSSNIYRRVSENIKSKIKNLD